MSHLKNCYKMQCSTPKSQPTPAALPGQNLAIKGAGGGGGSSSRFPRNRLFSCF